MPRLRMLEIDAGNVPPRPRPRKSVTVGFNASRLGNASAGQDVVLDGQLFCAFLWFGAAAVDGQEVPRLPPVVARLLELGTEAEPVLISHGGCGKRARGLPVN